MKKPRKLKPGQEQRLVAQRYARTLRARARLARHVFYGAPQKRSRFSIQPTRAMVRANMENQLRVPQELDLQDNFDETVEFIDDMRRIADRPGKQLILNFDIVERISPTAMTLLLAYMHRYQLVYPIRRVTGTYPRNGKVETLLQETGFFDVLGVTHRNKPRAKQFPLEHIKFITDNQAEGSQVLTFRKHLFGESVTMRGQARHALFRVLSEAMTNVVQHAYPKTATEAHPARNRWWLLGTVHRIRKELTITFCDLGVGIPETLPKLYTLERIRAFLSLVPGIPPNDGDMIRAGMELGRTSTEETNRGKGLNDLRRLINYAQAGSLYIFSNNGEYQYRSGGQDKVINHSKSVRATLIKWTVPMDRVTDWDGEEDDEPKTIAAASH